MEKRKIRSLLFVFALSLVLACSSSRMLQVSPEIGSVMSIAATDKDERCPAVSPDGKEVAYSALRRKSNGNWDFDIMAKSSEGAWVEQQIIASPDQEYSPGWYPDGKNLIFTTVRGNRSFLQKISFEGSHSVVELSRSGSAFDGRVSGKDTSLVFVESMNYGGNVSGNITANDEPMIVKMKEDGKKRTIIIPGIDPAISPDGNRIAFAKRVQGNWKIHTCNLDGTDLRMLQTSPFNENSDDVKPAWSPSGRFIVFASNRNKVRKLSQIWKPWKIWSIIFGERQWDLYKIDVKSGGFLTQLTRDPNDEYWPSWGSNGQIFFQSNHRGNWDIYSLKLK